MITLLETLVDGADGSYASKQDIRNLEHAMFAWSERKEAYFAVQTNEKSIIDRAMKLIQESKTFPEDRLIDEVRIEKCRRDITIALRYYALGMLLQDEEMLKDRFLYWQKNVLQAMGLHHYQGVKFVLEALCIELPTDQANLFKPYFKLGHDTIMSN
jgi:Phycobilisome protein